MNKETQQFFNKFYSIDIITYELALEVALIAAKEILSETSDPNKWNGIINDLEKA